jgi:hypothetical protein
MATVADIVCPDDPQGRTYRQINAAKTHAIPVGALVELPDGVRLFVVWHGRDCDGTPLYWLSHDKNDCDVWGQADLLGAGKGSWIGGHLESSLKVVEAGKEANHDGCPMDLKIAVRLDFATNALEVEERGDGS